MSSDPSTQSKSCPVTVDDLDIDVAQRRLHVVDSWSCSRSAWRPEETGSNQCIWHTETAEKPPDQLADTINDGDLHGAIVFNTNLAFFENFSSTLGLVNADLRGAILSGADLTEVHLACANLSKAILSDVNLTKANLSGADLTKADLPRADLTEATLLDANLTEAHLVHAELTEADLQNADLTEATLPYANFTEANLKDADLTKANLQQVNFSSLTVNPGTQIGGLPQQPDSHEWNRLSQSYHELKTHLSDSGLDQKARKARYLERRARTRGAWATRNILAALEGTLSRVLTSYGTRVSYVLGWTILLLLSATLWYALVAPTNTWEGGALYYSVVTFVTSPPHPPETSGGLIGQITKAVVLIETYLGTTLIILLGYVLSNRDRI